MSAITDPNEWRFWTCGNWPNGRTPARWEAKFYHSEIAPWTDGYSPSASLYVPEYVGDDYGDLWSTFSTGGYSLAEAQRKAMAMARELEAERDLYLDGLIELDATQRLFGTFAA